jgi:hypothetical protein
MKPTAMPLRIDRLACGPEKEPRAVLIDHAFQQPRQRLAAFPCLGSTFWGSARCLFSATAANILSKRPRFREFFFLSVLAFAASGMR